MQQENQRRERERDGLPNHSSSMASDPTWEGVKEDSGQNRKKNTRAKFTKKENTSQVHFGGGRGGRAVGLSQNRHEGQYVVWSSSWFWITKSVAWRRLLGLRIGLRVSRAESTALQLCTVCWHVRQKKRWSEEGERIKGRKEEMKEKEGKEEGKKNDKSLRIFLSPGMFNIRVTTLCMKNYFTSL